MKTSAKQLVPLAACFLGALTANTAQAEIFLAEVNFTNAEGNFDRTPTNMAPNLVTTSSGTSDGVFDGWTLPNNGSLRNDNGANAAGASSGNFPARLEGSNISFSITVNSGATVSLNRIEFDARAATGSIARGFTFTTNLEGPDDRLASESPLRARTPAPDLSDWERFVIDLSGPTYQNLAAGTTIAFIWATNEVAGHGPIDIDNITVTAVPASPATFGLTITPAVAPATGFDLEWESQSGKLYNLRTSTDLADPVVDWDPLEVGIVATPPANAMNVAQVGARRFYAVEEFDAPPLFSWDFEADDGGFTATGEPNDWIWGTPNSDSGAGLVLTTGNDGSTGAWATNLGAGGSPSGLINTAANSILRSPEINLTGITGAQLSFAAAYDAAAGDVIEVLVREVGTDVQLGTTINPINTTSAVSSNWITLGPFDLSAGDDKRIYLEFRYVGTDANFIGLYLDDVVVTQN